MLNTVTIPASHIFVMQLALLFLLVLVVWLGLELFFGHGRDKDRRDDCSERFISSLQASERFRNIGPQHHVRVDRIKAAATDPNSGKPHVAELRYGGGAGVPAECVGSLYFVRSKHSLQLVWQPSQTPLEPPSAADYAPMPGDQVANGHQKRCDERAVNSQPESVTPEETSHTQAPALSAVSATVAPTVQP